MLIKNSVYNYENRYIRTLWISKSEDIVYVIDIKNNRLPEKFLYSDLNNKLENNELIVEDKEQFLTIINEEKISFKDKQAREQAWKCIKNIVENEPYIYQAKYRRKLIMQLNSNMHENTIIKYLKRYWKRGMCKNALLPDYSLCGGRGKERKCGNLKRGRPTIYSNNEGINIDDKVKKIFNIAINKYYYNSSKKSLKIAYECMIKDYFSESHYKDNDKYKIFNEENIPTLGQFKYYFYKHRNIKKEVTSRASNKKYLQVSRSIIGNSTVMTQGPGDIFQVDATIADIYLCSTFDRNKIIGRPIIYFLVDTFSRMIVGLYVGLEGPSWIGASMAIVNAASSKKEFCKEYGIDITEDEWPVDNIPNAILADRGEFEGFCADNLINTFGIKVQNTPPYRADFKGIVEQYFNILNNQRIKPFLPGSIDTNRRERGDKDYRLDAKLNLNEFIKIIIKCVLYHNNQHYIENYPKEEKMFQDDIKPIPIELWNWGIRNKSGSLRKVNVDLLKISLMPEGMATVTAKGILFKKIYYTSSILMQENTFEKARNNGKWKVKIAYDPRNMNYIYIKDFAGKPFVKLTLIDYQSKYANKCIEEVDYINNLERIEKENIKTKVLHEKINLIEEIDSIVKEATKSFKSENDLSINKRSRLMGIRENREVEKEINREQEAFELESDYKKDDGKVISLNNEINYEDEEINKLNLLRRKQREKMNNYEQ